MGTAGVITFTENGHFLRWEAKIAKITKIDPWPKGGGPMYNVI